MDRLLLWAERTEFHQGDILHAGARPHAPDATAPEPSLRSRHGCSSAQRRCAGVHGSADGDPVPAALGARPSPLREPRSRLRPCSRVQRARARAQRPGGHPGAGEGHARRPRGVALHRRQAVGGRQLAKDGTTWTAAERLEPGTTYHVAGCRDQRGGVSRRLERTFHTVDLTLDQQTYASIAPPRRRDRRGRHAGHRDLRRAGHRPGRDRAEPRRRVEPAQAGTWHWISRHRGALAPEGLLEARHRGHRQRRRQRRGRRQRHLRPGGPERQLPRRRRRHEDIDVQPTR